MQIPQRRHEKLQVRDDSPIHLTPEGIQKLKDKLARLKASIPSLADEAKRTADYGDRSENAEYKEAKGKLRGAHRQILLIENQIKRAVPIKPGASGKIQIGSTVVVEIVTSSLRARRGNLTFEIVGPSETDPDKGRISYKSPLGAALLRHAKADTVTLTTPSGSTEYRVLEVK